MSVWPTYILDFKLGVKTMLMGISFLLFSANSFAQVTSRVDTTRIKIGEQISYEIHVKADSSAFVVFPEGQTFSTLEMVESMKIDTTKLSDQI